MDIKITNDYKEYRIGQVLYKASTKVWAIIIILIIYGVSDIIIRDLYSWAILRTIPLIGGIVYLVLNYTSAKNNVPLMLKIYYCILALLMVMVLGMTITAINTDYEATSVYALMLIIFVVYLTAFSSAKTLFYLYALPTFLYFLYFIIFDIKIGIRIIDDLSSAFFLMVGALIITNIQEKIRQNRYELSMKLKDEANIREELNIQLTKNAGDLKQKNKLLESQNYKIYKQRNKLIEQQNNINESIDYAKHLQSVVLPDDKSVSEILPDSFILHMPKDKISGDFYWLNEVDNKKIVIVADCTGHGVPGGILSILGIAYLNEIILKDKVLNPADILSKLRKKIKSTLKQDNFQSRALDGMDMGISVFDTDKKELAFAGAFQSICVFSEGNLSCIKGDRQPVAIHSGEKDFTNHTLSYSDDDVFYLFTDGYPDQFNSAGSKKFMRPKLYRLFEEIYKLPFEDQKKNLRSEFMKWKGDYDQIDDVLVIGFSVK